MEKEIDKPELLANIKNEFFNKFEVIQINHKIQGQRVSEDAKTIYLGCRAGPSYAVGNLLHEMSHMVEIDYPRINRHGWGLSYGKYWELFGKSGYEASTNQSVLRECRVWAFQYNVQQFFGIDESLEELVSSAEYLPAFCYMIPKKKGTFYKDHEAACQSAVIAETKKNLKYYNFELFKKEWFERVEYLEKQKKGI